MYRFMIIGAVLFVLTFSACSDSKKKLFELSCSTPTTCTRTANVYLVNVDGLFIEPRPDFVDECLKPAEEGKLKNPYCKEMILPGYSETFTSSERAIKHLQEAGFNPTDTDVERRMKLAEEKIYGPN